MIVVLPETTEQVSEILKYCNDNNVRVVPRGAGTSLSGSALPLEDGVLLGLGKFNRVLEVDFDNRCATVQPGVTNLGVTQAVQHKGFYYAARSFLADRLHHRRQYRGEFGRRALPQVRASLPIMC